MLILFSQINSYDERFQDSSDYYFNKNYILIWFDKFL